MTPSGPSGPSGPPSPSTPHFSLPSLLCPTPRPSQRHAPRAAANRICRQRARSQSQRAEAARTEELPCQRRGPVVGDWGSAGAQALRPHPLPAAPGHLRDRLRVPAPAQPERDLTVGPRRGRGCPAAGGCGDGEPGLSAGRVRDGRGGNRPVGRWCRAGALCGRNKGKTSVLSEQRQKPGREVREQRD